MRHLGYVHVDSGQVLITDPCYVLDDHFAVGDEPTGGLYDAACRITLATERAGQMPKHYGVVSSTAYGDGSYPVYAEEKDGHIVRLVIDFS